jgi:hypothetical protein
MGNVTYLSYTYFIVASSVPCIPTYFPANFTTLYSSVNECLIGIDNQQIRSDTVNGLLQYDTIASFVCILVNVGDISSQINHAFI